MKASPQKVYLETYGCQMNEYDSELIRSILEQHDYQLTDSQEDASVILLNTCAIRENAHTKIYARLGDISHLKTRNRKLVLGLLGCMSQNLKGSLKAQERLVDIFAGPDSYKRLPAMIRAVQERGEKQYDFALSEFEDYSDVYPRRVPGVNAWIAVMRGCDNFCTFCVVPYTRGRERSRNPENVVGEVEQLAIEGFKQVTLLGQNVNSYRFGRYDFADLMEMVAEVDGIERIRFTSPHPKDFPGKFLEVMARSPKICNHIHLPLQSGSNRVLELMARTYTREHFLDLVDEIRQTIPDICLSTDVIVGFCSETDREFDETLEVMESVKFDSAFMFKYSQRAQTIASRKYPDDISDAVKTARIVRLNELQKQHSLERNHESLGRRYRILVEGPNRKNKTQWIGRTDGNKIVVFDQGRFVAGDIIEVEIRRATANTLFGEVVSPGPDVSAHSSLRVLPAPTG